MIDVDVIEADGVIPHARLGGRRAPNIDFLPAQDFGAAGGVKTDGMTHGVSWDWQSRRRKLPCPARNFNRRRKLPPSPQRSNGCQIGVATKPKGI